MFLVKLREEDTEMLFVCDTVCGILEEIAADKLPENVPKDAVANKERVGKLGVIEVDCDSAEGVCLGDRVTVADPVGFTLVETLGVMVGPDLDPEYEIETPAVLDTSADFDAPIDFVSEGVLRLCVNE